MRSICFEKAFKEVKLPRFKFLPSAFRALGFAVLLLSTMLSFFSNWGACF